MYAPDTASFFVRCTRFYTQRNSNCDMNLSQVTAFPAHSKLHKCVQVWRKLFILNSHMTDMTLLQLLKDLHMLQREKRDYTIHEQRQQHRGNSEALMSPFSSIRQVEAYPPGTGGRRGHQGGFMVWGWR